MLLETERYVNYSSFDWQYTFISRRHLRLRGAPNQGWTGIRYNFVLHYSVLGDYKQDHCCVNFWSNDKRNKSGENLSFFNFPSNYLFRSKWIAAIGNMKGRISTWPVSC